MPKYHFYLYDGLHAPDLEGCVLPDLAAARATAVRFAGQVLQDNPAAFWEGRDWYLEVTDDNRLILFRLVLSAYDAPALSAGYTASRATKPPAADPGGGRPG